MQKSSNSSSRSSSSSSWRPPISTRIGIVSSRSRRKVRTNAQPVSLLLAQSTNIPDQSPPVSASASALALATCFHWYPPRSSVRAMSGGMVSAKTPSHRSRPACRPSLIASQRPQVSLALERRDVRLVRHPLAALVAQEPLEDVLTEGVAHERRLLHHGERVGQRCRQ